MCHWNDDGRPGMQSIYLVITIGDGAYLVQCNPKKNVAPYSNCAVIPKVYSPEKRFPDEDNIMNCCG